MRTEAVVVGVEEYAGGWNLEGPANDALRFAKWVHSRAENVRLFLSPLRDSSHVAQSATLSAIYSVLTNELVHSTADLLIFFWSGHGVMTADGTRRLLCADARDGNFLNVNFRSLLTSLRSDYFIGLQHQIHIVDACANYFEALRSTVTMPDLTFPIGAPDASRRQFVLLSAKPGALAMNVNTARMGLFSGALMDLLEAESKWPPDMTTIATDLSKQFSTLRALGKTEQTPAYFSFTDWDGSERTIGTTASKSTVTKGRARLTVIEKQAIAAALTELTSILDPQQREQVLRQLPNSAYRSMHRYGNAKAEALSLAEVCDTYGIYLDLVRSLRVLESDIDSLANFERLLTRLGAVS